MPELFNMVTKLKAVDMKDYYGYYPKDVELNDKYAFLLKSRLSLMIYIVFIHKLFEPNNYMITIHKPFELNDLYCFYT